MLIKGRWPMWPKKLRKTSAKKNAAVKCSWFISTMLSASCTSIRAVVFKCPAPKPRAWSKTYLLDPPPRNSRATFSSDSASRSSPTEAPMGDGSEGAITLQEWQGWGTMSPVPNMVTEIVEELKALEKDVEAQMSFGGIGGKLQVLQLKRCDYILGALCIYLT